MMSAASPLSQFDATVFAFLRRVFRDEAEHAWVTGFAHDPGAATRDGRVQAIAWGGGEYRTRRRHIRPEHNNYLCISTFRPGDDGVVRRRSALHCYTYAFMIDDVGEKVPPERIKLIPTFKVQTSPKSQQWWYLLAEPEADGRRVKTVIDNLINAGLMTDNRDPGMRGVNRYGRLPFGLNTKAKYKRPDGTFPSVSLAETPRWDLTPTLEEFAAAFGISAEPLASAAIERPPIAADAEAFNTALIAALAAEGLYKEEKTRGKHDVTCPWVHEHTGEQDDGAAVFEAGYTDPSTGEVYAFGGFRCHHGHGEDIGLRDVVALLRGRGYGLTMPRPAREDATAEFASAEVLDEELLELAPVAQTATIVAPGVPGQWAPIVVGEFECTDIANVARLQRLAAGRLLWHTDLGQWVYFNGTSWCVDRDGIGVQELCAAVGTHVFDLSARARASGQDEVAKLLQRWAVSSRSRARIDAMRTLLQSHRGLPVGARDFDRDPYLIGVMNGVVDLRTGQLAPPDLSRRVLNNTGIPFDPKAEAPDWEPYLRAVLAHADGTPDPEMYAYVRRLLGFYLTGLREPELFTICYGEGANGKSTLLGVLTAVMGDYARKVRPQLFEVTSGAARNASAATPELAQLPGARLVLTSETQEGVRLDMPMIKQMTGDDISARHLYRPEFTFTPQFKLLISTNYLPVITTVNHATWRRLHPIPFDRRWRVPGDMLEGDYPAADLGLKERLAGQMPGILAWLVSAARDFLAEGLSDRPTRVAAAQRHYRDESDVLGRWIGANCDVEKGARGVGLYPNYRRWCEESGVKAWSSFSWSRRMEERFGEPYSIDGRSVYNGVKLREFNNDQNLKQ